MQFRNTLLEMNQIVNELHIACMREKLFVDVFFSTYALKNKEKFGRNQTNCTRINKIHRFSRVM